jgi:hypothetical protein
MYADNEWDARMAASEWNETEQRYVDNPGNILQYLTKEQHSRLRELYREKEYHKKMDDEFHYSYPTRREILQRNPKACSLIEEILADRRKRAFDAYIEFVSNWHGLCEIYDGR